MAQNVLGPQKVRRSLTRDRVIQASVELLLENGVSAFSAKAVAERAGISRGALLKQFSTTWHLMAAITEHVIRESSAVTIGEAVALGDDAAGMRCLFERAWEDLKKPLFHVVLEIVLASRCNPELREHLAVVGAAIYRNQLKMTLPFFSRLGIKDEDCAELMFLEFVATMRGLVIERLFTGNEGRAEAVFGRALESLVQSVQYHAETQRPDGPVQAAAPPVQRRR